MKKLNVDKPLNALELDTIIINKLQAINVRTIRDLWILKRKELKEHNFNASEINHIKIKLQLYGIDLNKKIYI